MIGHEMDTGRIIPSREASVKNVYRNLWLFYFCLSTSAGNALHIPSLLYRELIAARLLEASYMNITLT
jgi:hypothetical protein